MATVPEATPLLNILYIEDNQADVRILKEYLLTSGNDIQVIDSPTLSHAIKQLRSQKFDAILADMGLPDSNGLETLQEIMKLDLKAPVIIMTGLDDEEMALQALKEGAADYLVKNRLNSENILRTIRYSIERKKLLDDLQKLNDELEQKVQDRTLDLAHANKSLEIELEQRRKNELELQKLNRTLNAQSKSSHAMLNAKEELAFMKEFCNIITNDCSYAMVWIGIAFDDENKSVHPVASAGFEDGYLETLKISWADTERGRGPTGSAIRTGKPFICRNMLTDPCFKPWRKEAIKRGYRSSIVLPLKTPDSVIGSLSIYSYEPDPFSESEAILLLELANDLAQGINAIRLRQARNEAEKQLKKYTMDLKNLNATKDKFFRIIAHDLKNPFTSLLGASELLYTNATEYKTDKIQKLSRVLNDSAKSGFDLLENLLEWSKTQTGNIPYNPETINVYEIAEKNINNLKISAASKNISIVSEIDTDIHVHADRNMLNTILRNLVANAIKFTHPDGKIIVKADNESNNITFSVKDSGIGIENENIEKLFRIDTKFYSVGTAKERGTGLGLLICKEFVDKHSGKIWVESEYGNGSEFKFTIPLNSDKLIGK
jgi:signal transduction histidine kinase/DNA-binding response OmpR family regulator